MARRAIALRKEGGILTVPAPKKGKPLPDSTIKLVKTFYYHDDYSRPMPGMKDKISIKRNVLVGKRLLLWDLDELYSFFKEKHPECKVSRSKFCELRPKECITVGSSGSHSVCVCTYHQNPKMMLAALNISETIHDLTDWIVCDRENKDCMLHRCENCPGIESMLNKLRETVIEQHLGSDASEDEKKCFFNEMELKFGQWTSTDRA